MLHNNILRVRHDSLHWVKKTRKDSHQSQEGMQLERERGDDRFVSQWPSFLVHPSCKSSNHPHSALTFQANQWTRSQGPDPHPPSVCLWHLRGPQVHFMWSERPERKNDSCRQADSKWEDYLSGQMLIMWRVTHTHLHYTHAHITSGKLPITF